MTVSRMTQSLVVSIIIFLTTVSHATAADRFIKKITVPSGQTAVIAEGEFESRSIGSFSVRLYQSARAGDETTFFSSGLIIARDGYLEKVLLNDIDGDSQPEIIVAVRSAGTGGYLSAHAFTITRNQSLALIAQVEELQPEADLVSALKKVTAK